jgi:hypothetical protein
MRYEPSPTQTSPPSRLLIKFVTPPLLHSPLSTPKCNQPSTGPTPQCQICTLRLHFLHLLPDVAVDR